MFRLSNLVAGLHKDHPQDPTDDNDKLVVTFSLNEAPSLAEHRGDWRTSATLSCLGRNRVLPNDTERFW